MTAEKKLQILLACGWFMLFVTVLSFTISAIGGLVLIGGDAFGYKPLINFSQIAFFTFFGLLSFLICSLIKALGDHIASEYLP